MRDVIVVGAGGGGPVVAKELAAQGLDVVLLEAGARHADIDEWTHHLNDQNNPLTGAVRFGPADRSKPAWFRETTQNGYLWLVGGVGGTTQHYLANTPRAFPGVFAGYDGVDSGAYDTKHRFPFSYTDFVPYYEWVEATLPVQTAPMGTKEEVFFHGCEKVGLPVQTTKTTLENSYRPQENAILQPGGFAGKVAGHDEESRLFYPQSTGCTFCGYCVQGCKHPAKAPRNLIAKRSTDNSYVPMALTADRWSPGGKPIELIADAFVTKVHTEQRNGHTTATGVTWRVGATGEHHREDAKVVVLAAGSVETPRLWFNSDLPNPNDWVGRGLSDHFFDWVTAMVDSDIGLSKGQGSAARADFPGRGGLMMVGGVPPGFQAFIMTLSDSGIRGQYRNGRGHAGTWDGPAGRFMGDDLKDPFVRGFDRLFNIITLVDDDVEAQNRVTLSALPADEHGPVAKVQWNHRKRSRRTLANREYLTRRAVEIARAAGAKKAFRNDIPPVLVHVHATMRMGHSEADSVLDPDGQARWVKGLYIADNSALSNSVGGPNPTLSTQALATRSAEKIFTQHFGGDGWVGTEAPVVSTDARVTRRLIELGLS